MKKIPSKSIIELIKQGDNTTLEKIYVENRKVFINFSKRYNINEYDALDIYQDTIIAFQENVINGKIDHLESSISTYLFAIGKYKIFYFHRKNKKFDPNNEIHLNDNNLVFDVNLEDENLTKKQEALKKSFNTLGERCKSVLNLFYYQGYTLDEITEILNYSDKKVLKSQKSRCLKQLKELVKKLYE